MKVKNLNNFRQILTNVAPKAALIVAVGNIVSTASVYNESLGYFTHVKGGVLGRYNVRMNAQTGKTMDDAEHLEQSIRDILLTPIGTRIMRRSYGSRLMYLLDQPVNKFLIASIQAAVVEALTNYEPRVKLTRVLVNDADSGKLSITIEGFYLPDSKTIRLENIAIQ